MANGSTRSTVAGEREVGVGEFERRHVAGAERDRRFGRQIGRDAGGVGERDSLVRADLQDELRVHRVDGVHGAVDEIDGAERFVAEVRHWPRT